MAENQKKAADLIPMLEKWFKQIPDLPANVREVLVKIVPWLALVFGIIGVFVGLGALGLSPVALLGGLEASFNVLVIGLISIVSSVLMLMAYPKLLKKQYKGWELLFWSEIISVVSAILTFSIASILGVVIGIYLLFQIKGYYK
jgi:hypothetical protein